MLQILCFDSPIELKMMHLGAREMVQELRALAALPGDLSLLPSNHVRWFTTTYNTSSREYGTLFWLPWVLTSM